MRTFIKTFVIALIASVGLISCSSVEEIKTTSYLVTTDVVRIDCEIVMEMTTDENVFTKEVSVDYAKSCADYVVLKVGYNHSLIDFVYKSEEIKDEIIKSFNEYFKITDKCSCEIKSIKFIYH